MEITQHIVNRYEAFEAEALRTLIALASGTGAEIPLNEDQQEALLYFPFGLKSLDKRLAYPTPTFFG